MIRFFTEHPTAANLLMAVFFVMGIFSIASLRRETFPDYSADEVEISVVYPGASAEDIEEAICRRIEEAVDGVNYVDEVRSEARENIAKVVVRMQEGKNFQTFLSDIKTEVDAIDSFPTEAEDPVIREVGLTEPVVSIAVTGPLSPVHLKAYSEDLKERLQLSKDISLVEIQGFSEHQFQVRILMQQLMQYGISIKDIADSIQRQSIDLPLGTIETTGQDVLIRFTDERRSVDALAGLVIIGGQSGAEILLGDIASIQDAFKLDEEKITINGQRAGLLKILKTKSQDSLSVFDAVKEFLAKEEKRKPPAVQFVLTQDASSIVRDRLLMLVKNGWQGLFLVFLTMWLFFNLRFSFWVAMGLPVSFLGAFFFLPLINFSINMFTMVGLLLALGLLMDDALVISENIASHRRAGKSPLQAAIEGTKEVKTGVLSSFATTIFVFGPISFLTGEIGKVMRVMPVMLILVLSVSIVEAFWILPHHLSHALSRTQYKKESRFRPWFDSRFEWVRENVLGKMVDASVRWRYVFLASILALFIISLGIVAGGILKFQAFPDIDGDVVEARILLPQGTPLKRTEAVVKRVTDALAEINETYSPLQPEKKRLVKNVMVQYNKNMDAYESGPHVATVSADLLKAEERTVRVDDIFNLWRRKVENIPDVISLKFAEPSITPGGLPLEFRFRGPELEILKTGALELQNWLRGFKGVFDISDDLRPGKPEIRIRLKEGATALGLNSRNIAAQLRAAFHGVSAYEIQVGVESYEINVGLSASNQTSLSDLENFRLSLPNGKQAPIQSVANLDMGRGYARIARVDGQRTVTVLGDIDTRVTNAAEIIGKLKNEFLPDFNRRYSYVRVSIEGQSKEAAKTAVSLRHGFLIGLIGIFILLSFQFRSYSEPFIVMMTIPLAAVGVIWGHLFMGIRLSMPSLIGFASLAGIVVNNSILLVEFVKIQKREGIAISEAVRQASRNRFRAITLTSLTTIVGLMPLLSEKSMQAQILIPLATSIVFGIMASAILVLFVVPSLYTVFNEIFVKN
ncbi:efflux RND transporter permease subunit [Thermodesulfobacteriota bacterium]